MATSNNLHENPDLVTKPKHLGLGRVCMGDGDPQVSPQLAVQPDFTFAKASEKLVRNRDTTRELLTCNYSRKSRDTLAFKALNGSTP